MLDNNDFVFPPMQAKSVAGVVWKCVIVPDVCKHAAVASGASDILCVWYSCV